MFVIVFVCLLTNRVPLRADKTPYLATVDCAKNAKKSIRLTPGLFLLMGFCHRLSTLTQNTTKDVKRSRQSFKNMVAIISYLVSKINKSSYKHLFDPTLSSYCKTRFWTMFNMLYLFSLHYNKISEVATTHFDCGHIITFSHSTLQSVIPCYESSMEQIVRLEKQTQPTIQRVIPSLILLLNDVCLVKEGDSSLVKLFKQRLKIQTNEVGVKSLTRVHYAACLLNPATRDLTPFGDEEKKEEAQAYIRDLVGVVQDYNDNNNQNNENDEVQVGGANRNDSDDRPAVSQNQRRVQHQAQQADFLRNMQQENKQNDENKDELDKYIEPKLDLTFVPTYKELKEMKNVDQRILNSNYYALLDNPMPWWRIRKAEKPVLEEVTSYILLGMAAQVKSESVFSIARRTVTDVRAMLSPDNVSNIVELHDWFLYKLKKFGKI